VADVVPLTGENRVIVKRGLAGLRNVKNPGLRALLEVSGLEHGTSPSARDVAFRIAPRINAAGRMASASDVLELFLTEDETRARALAAQLQDLNHERQQTEADITQAIVEQCCAQPVTDQDAALVFAGEGWHAGVVGIVASRVVERFHRPAFVLGMEDGVARGSGRSIRVFHLLEALEPCPELFTKFGGHRQAAGVTLAASVVISPRLRAYAAARRRRGFEPALDIDSEIDFGEISDRAVADMLNFFAPFGFGNPPPFCGARVEGGSAAEIRMTSVFLRLKSRSRVARQRLEFRGAAAELAPRDAHRRGAAVEDDLTREAQVCSVANDCVRDVRPS
jgi:single-stranded-DNA-specific exonuclease